MSNDNNVSAKSLDFPQTMPGVRKVLTPGRLCLYKGGGGYTGDGTDSVRSVGPVIVKVEVVPGGRYPSGQTYWWQIDMVDGAEVLVEGERYVCSQRGYEEEMFARRPKLV